MSTFEEQVVRDHQFLYLQMKIRILENVVDELARLLIDGQPPVYQEMMQQLQDHWNEGEANLQKMFEELPGQLVDAETGRPVPSPYTPSQALLDALSAKRRGTDE